MRMLHHWISPGKNCEWFLPSVRDGIIQYLNDASGRFSPADRIEYLKFSLEIPEKYNLQFTEWNRYSTEYGEIEIADVSFSRSFDMDMEGSMAQKGDAGGKGSLSRSEEQEVRSRYLKLNGSISDRKIGVEEEGTREIDLTGNVIADVSLEFEGFPERLTIPLFTGEVEDGTGEATVAALRFVDVLVPRMEEVPDTIKANPSYGIYIPACTDRLEDLPGVGRPGGVLFGICNERDFAFYKKGFSSYLLHHRNGACREDHHESQTHTGTDYPLQFKDYSDASRFMEWLLGLEDKDGVMIGKNTLLFGGKPVTSDQIGKEEMKVIPVY